MIQRNEIETKAHGSGRNMPVMTAEWHWSACRHSPGHPCPQDWRQTAGLWCPGEGRGSLLPGLPFCKSLTLFRSFLIFTWSSFCKFWSSHQSLSSLCLFPMYVHLLFNSFPSSYPLNETVRTIHSWPITHLLQWIWRRGHSRQQVTTKEHSKERQGWLWLQTIESPSSDKGLCKVSQQHLVYNGTYRCNIR